MARQLHLIPQDNAGSSSFRLDAETKALGRIGLAQARAALRAARASNSQSTSDSRSQAA